jgi:hypothetical protein
MPAPIRFPETNKEIEKTRETVFLIIKFIPV